MGWRGLLAGALGLAFLQVAVSGGSGRLGGLLSGAGAVAQRFLDPQVPAFSKPAPSSSSASPMPAPGPQTKLFAYPIPGTTPVTT